MTTLDVCGFLRSVYWLGTHEAAPHAPKRIVHDVPLVKQTSNWDCGLACVLMALRYSGDQQTDLETLTKMCSVNSIWTIDLAYLMKRLNMKFVFLTKTIGADPDLAMLPYYSEQMLQDQVRVNTLFNRSHSENVPILHQTLHIRYLRRICLSSCCLVILLVNGRKLRMMNTDDVTWILCYLNIDLGIGDELGYEGHYVMLSGYDERTRRFHIHDPTDGCYWISETLLDAARVSYGTDEDMIIVYTA